MCTIFKKKKRKVSSVYKQEKKKNGEVKYRRGKEDKPMRRKVFEKKETNILEK